MKCQKCRSGKSFVTDSRPEPETIRRRRKCSACGHVWTTFEITREQYERVPPEIQVRRMDKQQKTQIIDRVLEKVKELKDDRF